MSKIDDLRLGTRSMNHGMTHTDPGVFKPEVGHEAYDRLHWHPSLATDRTCIN
jgi:hypothetical protein